ncbi:hypothetical protein AAFF_G00279560 [Aldrovandia affinis]|uniref:Claudin n=1 Tax=Aldrovandia affinis TaxID=143900 RepID=A0AAD7WS95_9TELE|nr:hypothetical protein AAFF_G00279560 [Aldrovandia affinis]
MASMVIQLLGFFLGLLGSLGTVVAAVMPHWRRSVSVGSSALTDTAYMKGLWMECVWHSTGVYLCEIHRSVLDLPRDLQSARALMVLSVLSSVLAATVSAAGMKCTSCVRGSSAKTALVVGGGACFVTSGFLCLVTASWTTSDVVREFSVQPLPGSVRYELGQAVYLGYVSAALSISGGVVLCLICGRPRKHLPFRHKAHNARHQTHIALPLVPTNYPAPVIDMGNHPPSGFKLNDYV